MNVLATFGKSKFLLTILILDFSQIFRMKSNKLKYCRLVTRIFDLTVLHDIKLRLEWVCTREQLADKPSRTLSLIENRTRRRFVTVIRQYCTIDLFAVPENRVCQRYVSQYEYTDQEHRDALNYRPKTYDFAWIYPPHCLIKPTLTQLIPKCPRSIFLYHVYRHHRSEEALLNDQHQFRLLVGNRRYAFTQAHCRGNDKRRNGEKENDFIPELDPAPFRYFVFSPIHRPRLDLSVPEGIYRNRGSPILSQVAANAWYSI